MLFRGNHIYYILLSELILLLWFKENYIDFDVFPNRNSFALKDHGKSFPQERRLAFPFNLVEKVVTQELLIHSQAHFWNLIKLIKMMFLCWDKFHFVDAN